LAPKSPFTSSLFPPLPSKYPSLATADFLREQQKRQNFF
jgi:hypothetical protein